MSRKQVLVVALALAGAGLTACGDDSGDAVVGKPGAPGAPGAAPVAAGPAAGALVPRVHIEDKITDPAEKKRIRHAFKEPDFAPETNRDPFQSFVVLMPGTPTAPVEPAVQQAGTICTKPDQLVATNYSYADLKLVGIVTLGTLRKVLMMDTGNQGHIIKRGDCVGKEKALVKDIGTGYLTFVVMPENVPNGGAQHPPEEHSIQLHPNDLPMGDYYSTPHDEPRQVTPVAPPVAPTTPAKPTLQMPAPVPTPIGPAPTPVPSSPPVKT